jgi:hypothetical protein
MRRHLLALIVLVTAACGSPPPQGLRIAASTQARIDGELRIGAGNCWPEGSRPSCAIWITGAAPATYHYRVRAGETIHAGARRIEVLEVDDRSVVVAVSR